jgi:hypothetical protein
VPVDGSIHSTDKAEDAFMTSLFRLPMPIRDLSKRIKPIQAILDHYTNHRIRYVQGDSIRVFIIEYTILFSKLPE